MHSHYVIVKSTQDVLRDEWTNIGVIVYDHEGKQAGSRFDCANAKARGDYRSDSMTEALWVEHYARVAPTLEQLARHRDGMAHFMSCIQISSPAGSLLGWEELLADMFPRMVG